MKQQRVIRILFASLLSCSVGFLFAQSPTDSLPKDPGKISVYNVQNMNFGAFYQGGAGGTITMSSSGARSVTGSLIAINQGVLPYQSVFEIDAIAGTIINIQNGPDVTLTGSNGGSMTLHLGVSSPASPFVTTVPPPGRTQVHIGGTLTVGNPQASKPGVYTGSFSVMFIQQ